MKDVDEALRLAAEHGDDVRAQMAAAYALDRVGREREALGHYERAWALGVPAEERAGFLVGFGSTLRNCGRVEESVVRLGEAVAEFPEEAALRAFLALALHSSGQHDLAMATMLETALAVAGGQRFRGYERALGEYQQELVEAALGKQ